MRPDASIRILEDLRETLEACRLDGTCLSDPHEVAAIDDAIMLLREQLVDEKLPACPFCGHVPIEELDFLHPTGQGWRDDDLGNRVFRHYMRADDKRGVHGRVWELGCLEHEGGCGATITGDSREEAIMKWKRRVL